MSRHVQEMQSPYSPEQLFDLVADVAKYPEFLPWCSAARVINHTETHMRAQLAIRFKAFKANYTSEIQLDRPDSIQVQAVEGPFHFLKNSWTFNRLNEGGTLVKFELQFEFSSSILDALIGAVFEKAVQKMVGAFEARAAELYSNKLGG